jgi:hemerythrin
LIKVNHGGACFVDIAGQRSVKMPVSIRSASSSPAGERIIRQVRPLLGRQHPLGHGAIDSDHLAIADWWQQTVRCQPIQFAFFMARLKKLMRIHFEHEVRLMREAGGEMCACHRHEHQMLLELCDQAGALGRSNWTEAQSLLRTKLPRLVREHIISMDLFTVMFINTQNKIGGLC